MSGMAFGVFRTSGGVVEFNHMSGGKVEMSGEDQNNFAYSDFKSTAIHLNSIFVD